MGLDVAGIGAVADLARTVVSRIWPDKSAEEQQQLAAALTVINGQLGIDKAEAQSTDPLQHWRGGLGWVCTAAFAWTFVLEPMIAAGCAIAHASVALPQLDMGSLIPLTMGMLGLGALHVQERLKGAAG